MGQLTPTSKKALAEGRKVEALKHTEVLRIHYHKHEKPLENSTYRPIPLPKVKTIFFKAGRTCNLMECPCFSLARPRDIIRVLTTSGIASDDIWLRIPHLNASRLTLLAPVGPIGNDDESAEKVRDRRSWEEGLGTPQPQLRVKLDRLVVRVQSCIGEGFIDMCDLYQRGVVHLVAFSDPGPSIAIDDPDRSCLRYPILWGPVIESLVPAEERHRLPESWPRVQWMTREEYFASEGKDCEIAAGEWEKWLQD